MAQRRESMFLGYEVLGDSNMVRFLSAINKEPVSKNPEGCNKLGLCVSGQGVRQLARRVRGAARNAALAKDIIILIGFNDLRKRTPVRTFSMTLWEICQNEYFDSVTLLTLPLPPFYKDDRVVRGLCDGYNDIIRKMKGVQVLDLAAEFRTGGQIREYLFCKTYTNKKGDRRPPRVDLIHFNLQGIELVASFLRTNLIRK